MKLSVKYWLQQIDREKLKESTLLYLSDVALKALKLHAVVAKPILEVLCHARGIDTNVTVKKRRFDNLVSDMSWCFTHPFYQGDGSIDYSQELEIKFPEDEYVYEVARANRPQGKAGYSLFSGPDAIKRAQEYIQSNNRKRKEKAVAEVAAPKAKKVVRKPGRRPSGAARRKSARKAK